MDLFEFILSWDSVLPGMMSEWSFRSGKFSITLFSNNFSFSSHFWDPCDASGSAFDVVP